MYHWHSCYLEGDIQTTKQCLTERGRPGVTPPTRVIFDFFISFFKPMGYDYVDWSDPLPAWAAATNFGRYILQWLREKF